ncbi:hypothetical protein AAG906_022225 [Vitis piasezkii]
MQEMVIHSQAKHLVREAVIGRFEPHLYQIDIPYVNVNEKSRRIQLLDSRPGRKKTMLSWLAAHKKEVSPYDLRTFNFITPDEIETLQLKIREYVVLKTKCTPRPCPERLKGFGERVDESEVNGDRLKEEQHINGSLCSRDVISALARRVDMSLTE